MTIRDLMSKRMIGSNDIVKIFMHDEHYEEMLLHEVADYVLYMDLSMYKYDFNEAKWSLYIDTDTLIERQSRFGYLPDNIYEFIENGIITTNDYFVISVSDPYNMSFYKKLKYVELDEIFIHMKVSAVAYDPEENKYIFEFEFTEKGERHLAYKRRGVISWIEKNY